MLPEKREEICREKRQGKKFAEKREKMRNLQGKRKYVKFAGKREKMRNLQRENMRNFAGKR